MKKKSFTKFLMIALIASLFLTSCSMFKPRVIPRAVNTVNTVMLEELNLTKNDYQILKTVTAEAIIKCEFGATNVTINEENDEFKLTYKVQNGVWQYDKHKGIMRLGYLSRDYSSYDGILYPEDIARRTAIYRLINSVQELGADGIIEPTISTNIEQINNHDVIYKTIVTGKIVKLITNN